MPRTSFIRRNRSRNKGTKGVAPSSTPTPARTNPQKKQTSPRGVTEDEIFFSDVSSSQDDEGSSLQSDETTSSCEESSYDDDSAYASDAPKVFVDMIKNVFSASRDDDSVSNHNNGGDGGSTNKTKSYSKQKAKECYRLGLNENLTEMDIECGLIGKDIAKEMAEVLPNNNRLQKLCICCSNDKRQRQILRMLLFGLAGNTSVSELVIRGSACNAPAVKTKEGKKNEVFDSPCFDLNREAASLLSRTLAKHQSIQTICLKECSFMGSALAILFMGMQHSRIKEISIISSTLSDFNADIVSASLRLMELTSLSIVDASLTTTGLSYLCDNIKENANITKLNLSRNALGREGTTMLVKSIKSSDQCKLSDLMLSSCCLDDVAIHHLVKPLKVIPSLLTIDLSQNDISDEGALHLKGLLEKNSSIRDLRVEGNKISSRKILSELAEGLRYNNSVLKAFGFSATTSLAIFQTVDALEEMGGQIGASVSEAVNS